MYNLSLSKLCATLLIDPLCYYFSTITFHTGTFDPFDINKHTTGACIFISFDPFNMSKLTTI